MCLKIKQKLWENVPWEPAFNQWGSQPGNLGGGQNV